MRGKEYVCMYICLNKSCCALISLTALHLSVRELVSEVDRTVPVDDAGERVQRAVVHIRNILPEPRLVVHRRLVLRAHRGTESGLLWTTSRRRLVNYVGICMYLSIYVSKVVCTVCMCVCCLPECLCRK